MPASCRRRKQAIASAPVTMLSVMRGFKDLPTRFALRYNHNMSISLNLTGAFNNPYSSGFVLFWLATLIACISVWVVESRQGKSNRNLESFLFWLLGLAMLVFTIFRPMGIARDDQAYLEIFKSVCPSTTCGAWLQGVRDVGWYSLVGLLKSFVPDPRVMLWLGAAGLLIKLAVIYNLVKRPLFSLFFYVSLYYQVQDLTALRVSLALAVLMASIWLVVRTRNDWSALTLVVCGLFHKQAFVAPLILIGIFLKRYHFLLILLCLLLIGLLILGVYPQLHFIAFKLEDGFKEMTINQGLDAYISAKLAGAYAGWRQAPIVVYPQIMLTLWLLIKAQPDNHKLGEMMSGCLVVSCMFLWGFASLPDAQVRFFEFFMVPTVLLAGVRRLSAFEFSGLVFVSGIFVTKFNIIHQLIVQP